jgi:hypothetical protein
MKRRNKARSYVVNNHLDLNLDDKEEPHSIKNVGSKNKNKNIKNDKSIDLVSIGGKKDRKNENNNINNNNYNNRNYENELKLKVWSSLIFLSCVLPNNTMVNYLS